MAKGFANGAGAITFGAWGGLTNAFARQITSIGAWNAAVGDVTAIGAADGELRNKVVSGRYDPQPTTVEYLFDPEDGENGTHPTSSSVSSTLTLTYPGTNDVWTDSCGMTAFRWGDMLDDDVMVGECEFIVVGGGTPDDVQGA